MMSAKDEGGDKRGLLPRFTLKDSNTFLLADALGDIQSSDDGLFTNDTRILSRFELAIADRRPSLLGAVISQDNTTFTAHLTNRPVPTLGEASLPHGVIHIERSRFLCSGRLFERISLTNFSDVDADVSLTMSFAADFADIFEVQGHQRATRGESLPATIGERSVELAYCGRDEVVRRTHLSFSALPVSISAQAIRFEINLTRGANHHLYVEIGSEGSQVPSRERFNAASEELADTSRQHVRSSATVASGGRLFNQWIERSRADLALLTTPLPTGPYPYAGIPWFATQFGRDAIITALQSLWLDPSLAAGVVRFLAKTQAQEADTFRDSEPGKIMHETRRGEMAALGEVPFGQYYGGVDTTPLFVMLANAYEKRTGDRTLVDETWDALVAATQWIEQRLERSPTGFLDYARGEKTGLANQGWKDSQDSIFHANGRFPKGPIAVAEVQGYACVALRGMAELAETRGHGARANIWASRAERLQHAIEEHFWIPDMAFYALALDGDAKPCKVYASNAGHLLYCGVPSAERAAAVTKHLLSARFCSGWGIRTLAEGEPRYNPMSYHNGSIWPHDTALCAAGISRYGNRTRVTDVLGDIFEAANHFTMRLPELYCGFRRLPGHAPVPYPVACLPQAWAAGSIFMLLQASLGLQIDGRNNEVHIHNPTLPMDIDCLNIRQLAVGRGQIDLEFHRLGANVVVVPSGHTDSGIKVLSYL